MIFLQKREYERKCAEEMANFEKTFNQPAPQDVEEIDDIPQVKRKTNKRVIQSRESSVEVIIEEDESDIESGTFTSNIIDSFFRCSCQENSNSRVQSRR